MMKTLVAVWVMAFGVAVFSSEPLPTTGFEEIIKDVHGTGLYSSEEYGIADRKAENFGKDARDLERLAERTNIAMRGIIKISIRNLKQYGFTKEAKELEKGWRKHDGELMRILEKQKWRGYDIGDFKGISQWITDTCKMLQFTLGWRLYHDVLRISDLFTINHSLPIIFRPCTHGETEFTYHFCHDPDTNPFGHRGLAPVVAYWGTMIGCSIGTFAAGIVFPVCSPIAWLVELGVNKKVAPWLAPKIYKAACS